MLYWGKGGSSFLYYELITKVLQHYQCYSY